ncbi:MAG: hypothetical protein DRR16_09835 [Candidatus Parabeggiatoa sp. nov. 3]|nr:MAG: hypothetical protein DRR00_15115 [Gammaproteobacteria bacterium]RKZ62298.1 MAG: hypothetical protein DRQ99_19020 [Gammaproteobacteria bacterium]RKZ86380.1 MAG: hypothetical protein DRR16_09835 [Gammaproteobacteria bacterium]
MKQLVRIISSVLLVVAITYSQASWARYNQYLTGGWYSPTGNTTLLTSNYYDYYSSKYSSSWKKEHAGVDVVSSLNARIYAIGPGTVLAVRRESSSTKNSSVITIEHKTGNGKRFCAIYGHTYSTLKRGDRVSKGQFISKVKKYGKPVHIHFGINTSVNSSICQKANRWGLVKKGKNPGSYGFVDPFKWLNQNPAGSISSATLSRIRVYCPNSVSENSSSAGSCSATAYYSNGTNKDVTSSVSWGDNSRALRVYSNGRLKTSNVSSDLNVTVTASYGNLQGSATVRIKDGSIAGGKALDGKDPHATGCDRDGKTVAYKSISYGKIELRWSNSCKTNWTRVKANRSSYYTEAYLWRSSDSKYQTKSGKGTIWTPMFYAPNITACASGVVKGKRSSWTCR